MLGRLGDWWLLNWERMVSGRNLAVKNGSIWKSSGPTHKIQRATANLGSLWILGHLGRIPSGSWEREVWQQERWSPWSRGWRRGSPAGKSLWTQWGEDEVWVRNAQESGKAWWPGDRAPGCLVWVCPVCSLVLFTICLTYINTLLLQWDKKFLRVKTRFLFFYILPLSVTIHAVAAAKLLQSCPTLSDPMDYSLPGSSIHGIFQARVLESGAIAFSETKP